VRVVVSGSRTWSSPFIRGQIYDRLKELPRGSHVLHGDARGIDRIAGEVAKTLDLLVEVHPAEWEQHGKRAGIVRNIEMLDTGPDLVIAYWDGESRGTKHMIDAARERGVPVEVITQ
jgi:hypothetical protein